MYMGKNYLKKLVHNSESSVAKEEMLLDDVVYEIEGDYVPCEIIRKRTIGWKAVSELRSDPLLGSFEYHDEDIWDTPTSHLITCLGICVATCQLIEYYIVNSFLLGISKQQKQKYETINDLRNGWKRKTLGNMLKNIEEAWEIEPTLKANLELFLANRNRLIHGITNRRTIRYTNAMGPRRTHRILKLF
jgi:hypothetical protein